VEVGRVEWDENSPQDRSGSIPGKRLAIVAIALLIPLAIGGILLIRAAGEPARYGTPNGTDLPAGGITREMAIDIATEGTQLPDGSFVSASAGFDTERGLWVWVVSYGYSAGPTSGSGASVVIDFFTGEVLDRQLVVS
jgi:hypothetical protein